MTPGQIQREIAKIGKIITHEAVKGLNEAAREGVRIAKQESSGRWNRKRRQKAGYSYSAFDPNPPPQPLGIINVETGVFRAAWKMFPANKTNLTAFVKNESDRVADLVDATGKPWLSRPIDKRVYERIKPAFQFEIEKAIVRAINKI